MSYSILLDAWEVEEGGKEYKVRNINQNGEIIYSVRLAWD